MMIIAGLGNPGVKYAKTRHNVGFCVIDLLADRYHIQMNETGWNGNYGIGRIEGEKVILVKPLTFMNLSGDCIGQMVRYYKVDPTKELLVVSDDISLAPGRIRIRRKGSAGGHNGLKDIIAKVGTDQFMRVKIGVGEKPEGWDLADHVLGRFDSEDAVKVEEAFEHAVAAIPLMVTGKIEQAMNQFNDAGGKRS